MERSEVIGRGCPACRHRRGLTVSVLSEENGDGTGKEPVGMPVPCEHRGEIPEQVTHALKIVIGSPADNLCANALA